MYQATTPTITIETNVNLEDSVAVNLVLAQNKQIILEKHLEDVEITGNTIGVFLTQEETLLFSCDCPVFIQGRVKIGTKVLPIADMYIGVEEMLDKEIM